MIKLKEIIRQLEDAVYHSIESKLIKTKADNFLHVLRSYKEGKTEDKEIIKQLGMAANSFYVLKSRLYDRIQNELTSDVDVLKNDVFSQLALVHHVCYSSSNETAIAFLHKLEKNLLIYDMHGELLIVYSALKKLHYNTDKYFHYSQLHNRHVAFWLSLEKAEDTLSDFNLLFEQYDFSKAPDIIPKLQFLRLEIRNHSALNTSKQLNIIKNIMDVQLFLFCDIIPENTPDIDQLLKDSLDQVRKLSNSSRQKKWETVLDYLSFEYYLKTNQTTKANEFYEKTDQMCANLLLYSNVALVSKFLLSKIEFLSDRKQLPLLETEGAELLCNDNTYSKVQLGLYKAMTFYYTNAIKKAINTLNSLLTLFTLKDYFHIVMEIKFTLAFFYLKIDEISISESLITSIYRKIKSEKLTQYSNALDLIKYFNTFYTGTDTGMIKKRQESILLFTARNTGEFKLLRHLQSELKTIK